MRGWQVEKVIAARERRCCGNHVHLSGTYRIRGIRDAGSRDLNSRSTCPACSYTRNIPKSACRVAIKCNYFKYESAHIPVMKIEIDVYERERERKRENKKKNKKYKKGKRGEKKKKM